MANRKHKPAIKWVEGKHTREQYARAQKERAQKALDEANSKSFSRIEWVRIAQLVPQMSSKERIDLLNEIVERLEVLAAASVAMHHLEGCRKPTSSNGDWTCPAVAGSTLLEEATILTSIGSWIAAKEVSDHKASHEGFGPAGGGFRFFKYQSTKFPAVNCSGLEWINGYKERVVNVGLAHATPKEINKPFKELAVDFV